MRETCKRNFFIALTFITFIVLSFACASTDGISTTSNYSGSSSSSTAYSYNSPKKNLSNTRQLTLDTYSISETDLGGVERWYAVDKYSSNSAVRLQVGYFKERTIGFVLYEDGTVGVEARFSRQGLDLRWDWGSDGANGYNYAFVIQPDGTGLYYDFSTSTDGKAKPREFYKMVKF